MKGKPLLFLIFFTVGMLAGCASYYKKNQRFQEYVSAGEMEKARDWLSKNDKDRSGKNELLYYMNRGWVNWMLGDIDASNKDLEVADLLIEDQHKQWGYEALSLITNPGMKPYQAEDVEKVMVNYFKAMNYMQAGEYEDAIVEARRIIIRLQQLNSKYKDRPNKYSDDAFAHVIVGMLYEADGDHNNAFIAYRNALDAYEGIYRENFGLGPPEQLKTDLLRSAYLMGFYDELAFYEKKFGQKYIHPKDDGGDLVFIWHNGLGPVKDEWSITFTMLPGDAGFVVFTNEEYGLTFPFYIGDRSREEQAQLRDLNIVRVAFPKYVERKPVFSGANILLGNESYPLGLAEDINIIAFKTLHDRMLREFGNALLRVATKKAIELAVRKATAGASQEGKLDAGDIAPAALTIINAVTEKADTRNWQTLPHSIYYTRIRIPAGKQKFTFRAIGSRHEESQQFEVDVRKGKTMFIIYQSLESHQPGM
jgi:uncharacterized protein